MKLPFASDYMDGAHPAVLEALVRTNGRKVAGYGEDELCEEAREKIREACGCPDAEVFFVSGGTQANATVLGALLAPYQGVLCAVTGHINGHEAGAVEKGGHKVLPLPAVWGKITAQQIRQAAEAYLSDMSRDHVVMPGAVYLSQPTELGTLYTKTELEEISSACKTYGMPLYIDGARLAYALACPANDITIPDLARLCDVFYIGGTKCGALCGEAVVVPVKGRIPHFFSIIKQDGALLAKGRMLGVQFGALFTDDVYFTLGENAIRQADKIRDTMTRLGIRTFVPSPTNQLFAVLEDRHVRQLQEKVQFNVWEKTDAFHTVVRFVTGWSTTDEETDALVRCLEDLG